MYHMKLIAISWPTFFDGEAEIINSLFEAGLPILHVRKPGAVEADVANLIKRVRPEFHERLTMHYFPAVAEAFELGGYHLSAGRAPQPDGWEGRLSASCHTLEEARQAQRDVDYVFLSPIFDSISKRGYAAGFSTDELLRGKAEGIIGRRVIALGGVTPENMGVALDMGFGGVAVLGGLWGTLRRDDVTENYWHYLNWERCGSMAEAL